MGLVLVFTFLSSLLAPVEAWAVFLFVGLIQITNACSVMTLEQSVLREFELQPLKLKISPETVEGAVLFWASQLCGCCSGLLAMKPASGERGFQQEASLGCGILELEEFQREGVRQFLPFTDQEPKARRERVLDQLPLSLLMMEPRGSVTPLQTFCLCKNRPVCPYRQSSGHLPPAGSASQGAVRSPWPSSMWPQPPLALRYLYRPASSTCCSSRGTVLPCLRLCTLSLTFPLCGHWLLWPDLK